MTRTSKENDFPPVPEGVGVKEWEEYQQDKKDKSIDTLTLMTLHGSVIAKDPEFKKQFKLKNARKLLKKAWKEKGGLF